MQKITRKEVERGLIEAIDKAELRPFQRLRLRNILERDTRPALKENMIDRAMAAIEEDGSLEEAPDGTLSAVDWSSFFETLLKYLPMILKLFGI